MINCSCAGFCEGPITSVNRSPPPAFGVSFLFQAEDGIRFGRVTGVQTCALPISGRRGAIPYLAVLTITVGDALAVGARAVGLPPQVGALLVQAAGLALLAWAPWAGGAGGAGR